MEFECRLRGAGFEHACLRAVLNAVKFDERHGYEQTERVLTRTTNGVPVESLWMRKQL